MPIVRVLITMQYYRERGMRDAIRGKAPIFARKRNTIECTIDDPAADEWSQEKREAYVAGYEGSQ